MAGEDGTVDEGEEVNALSMSDADFDDFDPADFDESEAEDESGEAGDESEGGDEDAGLDPDDEFDEDEGTDDDTDADADTDGEEDEDGDADPDPDPDGDADDSDGDDSDDINTGDTDFEDFYNQVTAGFTANGRQMKINSAEDAIKLMQMGAGFNKKMAALKPNLKMLKMLDKHGLMSEEKLSFFIDLQNKDPKAIAKLVADANIDPLDLDTKDVEYQAADHSVDDREMALEEVVSEIKDSATYDRVSTVVLKEWDGASKQAIADDPQLLKALNDQMASGVYDLISTEMEQESMFGRLAGKSDIEAYQLTGQKLAKEGAFDHLNPSQGQGQQKQPNQGDPAAARKKEQDEIRRKKRKAASLAKTAAKKKTAGSNDFNPLSMTDADFEKQFDAKFLP